MKFKTVSIAAHTTWNFCPEYNFLIDCGEGLCAHCGMGPATAVENILLTHDHMDHVAGLLMLIHLRKRAPASDRRPLRIWIPYWSARLKAISDLATGIDWTLVVPGDKIHLGGNPATPIWATPFRVRHADNKAVGYKIFHTRKQLAPAYRHLGPDAIRDLANSGVNPNCLSDHHMITYTGDTMPLHPELLGTPKLLVHEATFQDRDLGLKHEHSVLQDAVEAAALIGAALVVNHLSLRYLEGDINAVMPPGIRWIFPKNTAQEYSV